MKRSGFKPKSTWKGLKRGAKLKPLGKKGNIWYAVRQQLKKRFEWAGITICEFRFPGCYYDASGGFAHCKKRRKLEDNEIWHVGLSCLNCHTKLDEKMTHEEMHAEVHKVIDRRGLIAPPAILQQIQSSQDGGERDNLRLEA